MTKKLIFLGFLISILLACTDSDTSQQQIEDTRENNTSDISLPQEVPTIIPPEALEVLVQEKTMPEDLINEMTNGYWHYKGVFKPSDKTANDKYKGRWVQFMNDQTLRAGQWNEQEATGRWSMNVEKNILALHIERKNPEFYEVELIGRPGSKTRIWKDTRRFSEHGAQYKMVNYLSKPTQNAK